MTVQAKRDFILFQAKLRLLWLVPLLLAGCASTNTSGFPGDAIDQLGAYLSDARDSARERDALGWPPVVADYATLTGAPGDKAQFAKFVCEPRFALSNAAVKTMGNFNDEVTGLAKAPDATFAGLIKSIQKHQQQIDDLAKAAKAPASGTKEDKEKALKDAYDKCVAALDADLRGRVIVAPAAPILSYIDAFLSFLAIPKQILTMVEAQKRADAVKAYVAANETEINKALEALGRQDDQGLRAALDAARTHHARKAYVYFSDVRNRKCGCARDLDNVERMTSALGAYASLADVTASKLLTDKDEGLIVVYAKFFDDVKKGDPLTAFDNFVTALQNISDLNKAIGDYKKARGALSGSSGGGGS